jgi:hypothetical protein
MAAQGFARHLRVTVETIPGMQALPVDRARLLGLGNDMDRLSPIRLFGIGGTLS